MKAPPPPSEKGALSPHAPAEPGPRRAEEHDFEPRYVALPSRRRERNQGQRNLAGGVVLMIIAALLFFWSLSAGGAGSVLVVVAAFGAAALLHVMARSRLFRQRNSAFLAWGSVALLGVFLSLVHGLVNSIPPRTVSATPAATPAPAQPSTKAPPAATARKTDSGTPLLREAFNIPKIDPDSTPAVRITRDTIVNLANKAYQVKVGELYPLYDLGPGEISFNVEDQVITIPTAAGEAAVSERVLAEQEKLRREAPPTPTGGFHPPGSTPTAKESQASPAEITKAAQFEAVRRYPALGVKGSPENQLFVSATKEQRFSGANEFFANPHWPLVLAELLAEKEGWKRADAPEAPEPNTPPPGGFKER